MYQAHWNLETTPFHAGCETEFYYPSETHQAALLKLRYAIENRQGAAMMVAESGLGKTVLARTLLEQLGDTISPKLHLVFSRFPASALLAWVHHQFYEGDLTESCLHEQFLEIEQFLSSGTQSGKHAVWIIDEAHLVTTPASLETLRLLTNFQSQGRPDWTLIFVGQMPLVTSIQQHASLDERMAVKCVLQRLNADETAGYIMHRIRIAGGESQIFTDNALQAVHELSQGIPRRINRICDLALLVGFAEERTMIGDDQIREVQYEITQEYAEIA